MIIDFEQQQEQKIKVIPLGESLYGKFIFMRPPVFKGRQSSNTILIGGMSGSGKSVLTRANANYMSQLRPVYIFDWAGRDHYLGYKPNSKPKNLPKGASPRALYGRYYFYPTSTARKKRSWEQIVRPDFNKYGFSQLSTLGFSGAGPVNLQNFMQNNGPFISVEGLYKELEVTRRVPKVSKESILRDLNVRVLSKGVWNMHPGDDLDIDEAVRSGDNLVFSYNDLSLARAEIDYFLKRLIKLVDQDPKIPRPFLFIEEAHDIFNDELLGYFVLVCRKLGIGVVFDDANTRNTPKQGCWGY